MTAFWWQLRLWQRAEDAPLPPADWMLRRADDRWLDDIGLSRNDLRCLLRRWDDQSGR